MAEQFTGTVEILNSESGQPTIVLEGGDDEGGGSLTLGGHSQDGDLVLRDGAGRQKVFATGQRPFLQFQQDDGNISLFLDGARGHVTAGGLGSNGKLMVRNSGAGDKFVLDASANIATFTGTLNVLNTESGRVTVEIKGGDDESGGSIVLGGSGEDGDLVLKDEAGRQRIFANGGRPFLRFEDGRLGTTINLDGLRAEVVVGGARENGRIIVRNRESRDMIELNGATGDIVLSNADCAEDFEFRDTSVEAGTVVVIDDEDMLTPCTAPYDKRVAGVVSGAGGYKPGIVLDRQQPSPRRRPVALVGKVYCKVDAQYGPIEVGDLLTTSPTPGHAMKAADPGRAFGAVFGKALRALPAGSGLVPILVALQ